jgi:hypothetical protein
MLAHAAEIHEATRRNAVVLTPESSMVPVYYARRHLIRGIAGDRELERALPALRGVFPGSPVYLALAPHQLEAFPGALRSYPVVRRTAGVVLLSLGVIPGPASP